MQVKREMRWQSALASALELGWSRALKSEELSEPLA
jgi:hypothetical protein